MHKSLAIIREEHRALATVLHGLQYVVKKAADRKAEPDFKLLHALIGYILDFPIRLHHPKEDEHLFELLRVRDPSVVPVLDALEAEHDNDRKFTAALRDSLEQSEQRHDLFPAFAAAVEQYAAFQWAHMRKEEDLVLPAAERSLSDADWAAIDSAFAANNDPLAGVDTSTEFRVLFERIMNAMPAPVGTAQR